MYIDHFSFADLDKVSLKDQWVLEYRTLSLVQLSLQRPRGGDTNARYTLLSAV